MNVTVVSALPIGLSLLQPARASVSQGQTTDRTVPAGTVLDVRLKTTLDSGASWVDQPVKAVTIADVAVDNRVLLPAGTEVTGKVIELSTARSNRVGRIGVLLEQVLLGKRVLRLQAEVEGALDGRDSAVRLPLANTMVGRGLIFSTGRDNVRVPAGTILRLLLKKPMRVS